MFIFENMLKPSYKSLAIKIFGQSKTNMKIVDMKGKNIVSINNPINLIQLRDFYYGVKNRFSRRRFMLYNSSPDFTSFHMS